MNAEATRRAMDLAFEAAQMTPSERDTFLERECAGDGPMRLEVESLLTYGANRSDVFDDSALDEHRHRLGSALRHGSDTALPDNGRPDSIPTPPSIERYAILRLLGRGGMGTVWLARRADEHFKKQVAIKVVKRGMDTDEILARFRRERQVLAHLEHPNIARLLDGGATASGLPYLVMEYIVGDPIDQYCQEQRLSLEDRLRLFMQVCRAVQHAHQHLIIHRDLKPSNLLVMQDGTLKLLDFGIAKLLTGDDAEQTLTAREARPLTPRYASPEQVSGDRITTASDVYSLGVVLYELLTGRTPHDGDSGLQFEQAIREQDPKRPSEVLATLRKRDTASRDEAVGPSGVGDPRQLRRRLAGDLDTIVLKALHRDPGRRYASAEQFAVDIRRHLDGLTVMARPDSLGYRAAKFIRRNAGLVVTGSLLIAVMMGWVITSTRLLFDATAARDAESEIRIDAEWQSYIANIAAAEAALQVHRTGTARMRLEMAPEHLRNWEWRHLHQRLDQSRRVLGDSKHSFSSVAITPNGRTIVASSMTDGRITFWDASTGEVIRTLSAKEVWGFALSPDGTRIAWHASDRQQRIVHVIDAVSGETLLELTGHEMDVESVTYSPDGRLIAAGSYHGVTLIWDGETGRVIHQIRPPGPRTRKLNRVRALAFGPNSQRLAIGDWKGDIRILDCATGDLIHTLSGHGGRVLGVSFSPDGSKLASASSDRTARIWNPLEGKELLILYGHNGVVEGVAFNPLGDQIVTTSRDQTLRRWDVATGRSLAVMHGHTDVVFSAAWDSGSDFIASTSEDGTVRIWDADLEGLPSLAGTVGWIHDVDVSPDGLWVAGGGVSRLLVSDLQSGETVAKLDPARRSSGGGHTFCLDFSPDGRRLAAAGIANAIRIWDVNTWKETATLRGHTGWVMALAFSPDSRQIVSGGRDRTVRVWDVSTGETLWVSLGHEARVTRATFSPDGLLIATASEDRTVRFWNADTGDPLEPVLKHDGAVYGLDFSPGGTLLATGSSDGKILIWGVSARRKLATLDGRSGVRSVTFSPDGSRVGSGHDDHTIKLWDVDLALHRPHLTAEAATFRGHFDRVNDLAFSPDGSTIVSGGRDYVVRMWYTTSANE